MDILVYNSYTSQVFTVRKMSTPLWKRVQRCTLLIILMYFLLLEFVLILVKHLAVMPFMARGSLLYYLKKERPNLTIAENSDDNVILDARKQFSSMCLQVAIECHK